MGYQGHIPELLSSRRDNQWDEMVATWKSYGFDLYHQDETPQDDGPQAADEDGGTDTATDHEIDATDVAKRTYTADEAYDRWRRRGKWKRRAEGEEDG